MNPENEKSKGRSQTYLVWGWLAACRHRDFKVSNTSCKKKIIKNAGDRTIKRRLPHKTLLEIPAAVTRFVGASTKVLIPYRYVTELLLTYRHVQN
jgi:hypothetical protein